MSGSPERLTYRPPHTGAIIHLGPSLPGVIAEPGSLGFFSSIHCEKFHNIRMSSIIPLLTEFEKQHLSERQALPEKYLGLSDAEMDVRIAAARAELGSRLVILGHHYQIGRAHV